MRIICSEHADLEGDGKIHIEDADQEEERTNTDRDWVDFDYADVNWC